MESQLSDKVLNRYDLHERLGRGGMGDVYKGWDTTLERWVAIKVLHGHLAEQANFRQRFEREAKAIAGLSHPNIVRVYDYGFDEAQSIYCIVLEFLPSETLEDRMDSLREQDLPARLEAVESIFPPLIEAVAYAHERDMVHRDIKPSNILFNQAGTPVLADFGLVRLMSSTRLTLTGAAAGTPAYMSPEQGMGEGGDSRSDIYSLGVILYEMLAGMTPFSAETPFGIIMKHVNEPLPSLTATVPQASAAWEKVISRALAKQPDDRYQSASDMLADVLAAAGGRPLARGTTVSREKPAGEGKTSGASTITWSTLAPELVRRPTVLFGALGALGVILVAAIALSSRPAAEVDGQGVAEADVSEDEGVPSATGPDEEIPSMTGPMEFSDDFSDPETGWPVEEEGPVRFAYQDGRYRFTNTLPGQARLVVFYEDIRFTATYLQAEAVLEDGQPESGYGLVFRWQDTGHFYVFAVNGVGQVSMWAFEEGTGWRELRGLDEEWTDSPAVLTGGQSNVLTVVADGDHLIGMVNHEVVIDLQDATYDEGAVGFYVATTLAPTDEPLADVFFDDFLVEPSIAAMTS